jgi:HDOD domain
MASLVVRPDWSLNEAADLVEFDAALSGRLLRLANSAAEDVLCDVVCLANIAAKRIGEGVVRGPAEVRASETCLARLGLPASACEDLLLTLPAAFDATLAQYTKD